MNDIAYEFRAHSELWGITEPNWERDVITMEWVWVAYYAPISFGSHSKKRIVGLDRSEVIATTIQRIVDEEVLQINYAVRYADDPGVEECFVDGEEALQFAQAMVERNSGDAVDIYRLRWGGRDYIRTLGGDK